MLPSGSNRSSYQRLSKQLDAPNKLRKLIKAVLIFCVLIGPIVWILWRCFFYNPVTSFAFDLPPEHVSNYLNMSKSASSPPRDLTNMDEPLPIANLNRLMNELGRDIENLPPISLPRSHAQKHLLNSGILLEPQKFDPERDIVVSGSFADPLLSALLQHDRKIRSPDVFQNALQDTLHMLKDMQRLPDMSLIPLDHPFVISSSD